MTTHHVNAYCLLVMTVLSMVRSQDQVCSSEDQQIITFSINSQRNESRHRAIYVDLGNSFESSLVKVDPVLLEVKHSHAFCGSLERMHVTAKASAQEPVKRHPDYELFPGIGYYKLHTTPLSWDEARSACVREQAHLIVMNSEKEAGVIRELFSRNPKIDGSSNANYWFIGFHDKYTEGQFVTVTGDPLNSTGYIRWAAGQPNGGAPECFGGADKNGHLHDIPKTWKLAYVCEQEF